MSSDKQIAEMIQAGEPDQRIMDTLRCGRRRVLAVRDRLGAGRSGAKGGVHRRASRMGLAAHQRAAVRACLLRGDSIDATARAVTGATLHYVRQVRQEMLADGSMVETSARQRARRERIAERLRAGEDPASIASAVGADLRRVHDVRREMEVVGRLDGTERMPDPLRRDVVACLIDGRTIVDTAERTGATLYLVRLVRAGLVAEGRLASGRPPRNDRRHRPPKKSSGRRCRRCGRDPAPNYFFCLACHHDVSLSDEGLAEAEADGASRPPGWSASREWSYL